MATAGSWDSLAGTKLDNVLVETLVELSYPTMTPVQAAAVPPLLTSKDVCVQAETGSGKTLSFLVPIAQKLLFPPPKRSSRAVWAIVVLPTRELAAQVHAVAKKLFAALPGSISPVSLIGGSANAAPDDQYDGDHRVIIATPGRLSAAVAAKTIQYSKLEMLILDEADRLLDMGFSVTLTDILTKLPKQRRTGIYSATQTEEVESLARAGMRNPVRVVVKVRGVEGDVAKRRRIPASLRCYYALLPTEYKLSHLLQLLAKHPNEKFIVYFLTCACIDYYKRLPLQELLKSAAIRGGVETKDREVTVLHGKMSQARRVKSLATYTTSDNGVLLCTDVAARGIDIPNVDWVVQFDPPQDPDAYIHRVGRTARLGREGNAVIYISPSEDAYIDFLRVRKCPVSEMNGEVSTENKVAVDEAVRQASLKDRAVLEASEAAFLSYIRAYREHKCRYLLKLEEVDINGIADVFGLLRLPRFHEFKKFRGKIRKRGEGVVVKDIAFKDRKREALRQAQIREAVKNRVERREALAAKSKKRKRKNKRDKHAKVDVTDKQNVNDEEEEEEDFGKEAWQLRKLKRGKLTEKGFDEDCGYDSTGLSP